MMRKTMTAMLLAATIATPLLAQDRSDWRDGGRPQGQPQGRPQGQAQPQAQPQPQRGPAPEARPQQGQWGQSRGGGMAGGQFRPQQQPQQGPGQAPQGPGSRGAGGWQGDRHDASRPAPFDNRSPYAQHGAFDRDQGQRHDDRPGGPGWDDRRGAGDWTGRSGDPGRRDNPGWNRGQHWNRGAGRSGWDAGWRNDRRYDWRGWRAENPGIFRGPRYYAPRGWTYRRFSPGYRLEPFLFDEQYWLDDPWDYRLPPADGPYRWVRYYDDVLLVDIRNGLVVDVIPGFFD